MSEQPQESEWSKREMGAFWRRQSQKGQKYLSGHVTLKGEDGSEQKVKVVVFSNKNKSSDRAPDYCVYASTPPQESATVGVSEDATDDVAEDTESSDEDVL